MPDDRTRVLVFSKGLGRGGTEQLIATSAKYWDRDRFDYHVAHLLAEKDELVPVLQERQVPVHLVHSRVPGAWVSKLRALAHRLDCDVLHLHSPHPAALARPAMRGRRRPRVVYTEHAPWSHYKRPTYWANAITYAANDHVFAVSDEVRDSIRYPDVLKWRRMPERETLYHGFDPEVRAAAEQDPAPIRKEFGFPDDAVVGVMVANFRPQKRHWILLDAVARAREQVPHLRLLLVGGGPLEPEMRCLAESTGVDDLVTFTGFRSDVPRLVSQSDVFVLSSAYEGLPIALLEALALRRPVVVTDVVGTREAVNGPAQGGLVVTPDDAQELASALVRITEDASLRRQLAKAAAARAADFSIVRAVHRQEELYTQLVTR